VILDVFIKQYLPICDCAVKNINSVVPTPFIAINYYKKTVPNIVHNSHLYSLNQNSCFHFRYIYIIVEQ